MPTRSEHCFTAMRAGEPYDDRRQPLGNLGKHPVPERRPGDLLGLYTLDVADHGAGMELEETGDLGHRPTLVVAKEVGILGEGLRQPPGSVGHDLILGPRLRGHPPWRFRAHCIGRFAVGCTPDTVPDQRVQCEAHYSPPGGGWGGLASASYLVARFRVQVEAPVVGQVHGRLRQAENPHSACDPGQERLHRLSPRCRCQDEPQPGANPNLPLVQGLTLEALAEAGDAPERDSLAVVPEQVVGSLDSLSGQASSPRHNPLGRQRRGKLPASDGPPELTVIDPLGRPVTLETGERHLLDLRVRLVHDPPAELDHRSLARINPVVVVAGMSADAEVIAGLKWHLPGAVHGGMLPVDGLGG